MAPEADAIGALEGRLRDPGLCRGLLARLEEALRDVPGGSMRFMEVCGTHTVSLFRSGLRSMLPEGVEHLSGPGCPVCVTHDSEVAAILEIAALKNVTICTFGDLVRVPGPGGRSLRHAMADGARVRLVYSPLESLAVAEEDPSSTVVLLGAGFETTAPAVAAAVLSAEARGIRNLLVLSLHKLVPPALRVLLADDAGRIDAFLLPGHVAVVTGLAPFRFLAEERGVPGCVGGFEPADMLLALCRLAEDLRDGRPTVSNAYPRAVPEEGNPRARELMDRVFEPADALWRGLGRIPASGLRLRPEHAAMDALAALGVELRETPPPRGCRCGDVLKGRIRPPECPLFGRPCTPLDPVGPCMVSSEGSCAAHYKYAIREERT